MSGYFKRAAAAALCVLMAASSAACVRLRVTDDNIAVKLFKNSAKAGFSDTYAELADDGRNGASLWRQGMVSGNGSQGFVTSGAPFSDSMIFQNIRFVMPSGTKTDAQASAAVLEKAKQTVVAGKALKDAQPGGALSAYHPGGALRIDTRTEEKQKLKSYLRYTDYESGEVGVYYSDQLGMWDRRSFTSFADDAVITSFSSPSGARLNLTLSFDDPGTLAGFGEGKEADCRYKTYVSKNGDCIAFLGHYPDDANSPLREGGWATVTYILTDGGKKEPVPLERRFRSEQDVTDDPQGVRIENAYAVYLITRSVRTEDMGKLADFADNGAHRLVREARRRAREIAEAYSARGYFDYAAALKAHKALFTDKYNAVTLQLGKTDNEKTNDALLRTQRGADALQPTLLQRAYYAARYFALCCEGTGAPRSCGMWTGEFNAPDGGRYDLTAGVPLQAAGMNAAGLADSTARYAAFVLRQLPAWEENARATHGFEDAIQAPGSFDGENAAICDSSADAPTVWYNAGTARLLRPLFEALQTNGDVELSLPADCLKALAPADEADEEDEEDEAEEEADTAEETARLDLRTEILLPLLTKAANYWLQLLSPEYYTDSSGGFRYEAGRTALDGDETYCVLPSYIPGSGATANQAADIAACADTMYMLLTLISDAPEDADIDPEIDTEACEEILKKLPAYPEEDGGALLQWVCAGPAEDLLTDKALRDAGREALKNGKSDPGDSRSLALTALAAARLGERGALTDTLLTLEKSRTRSDSLLTDRSANGGGAFCADYALGYTEILHEALVRSAPGKIELLPCVPVSGFELGSLSGLATRARATLTLMSWDMDARFVIADITSDIEQEIHVSSPISGDEETLSFSAGETKTVKFDLALE